MKRVLAVMALLAGLAGCITNPATVVDGLQAAYGAAATAESVWIKTANPPEAQIALVEQYRLPAYNQIEPLVKAQEACDVAAAAGQTCTSPVTVAQEEAAQKILTALTNYEISQGITKGAAQ